MATTEKIIVFVGDEKIELSGSDKSDFIAQKELFLSDEALLQADKAAKVAAKQSAMDKLTALGLTADEVAALLP